MHSVDSRLQRWIEETSSWGVAPGLHEPVPLAPNAHRTRHAAHLINRQCYLIDPPRYSYNRSREEPEPDRSSAALRGLLVALLLK
jgi:hypothetical protein